MARSIRANLILLSKPVAGDSVLWARRLFFALASISALRFVFKGWVGEFYVEPSYHFTWPWLHFVAPLPQQGMLAVFIAMALCAAVAAFDRFVRPCALIFTTLFVYVELLDRTYYLNHYYLITLVAALFAITAGTIREADGHHWVPRWMPLLLRAQVGLVYFYAGIAKLNADFLLRGEPLHTWLMHYGHVSYVGPLLTHPATAIALSWAGTLFDLLVVPALMIRAMRTYAYATVVCFHIVTFSLFDIGVFPWFMIALATIFFAYDWPRHLLAWTRSRQETTRPCESSEHASEPAELTVLRPSAALFVATYLLLQIALPLRHVIYPGPVNWNEEGFRFAWRVMLFEKTGRVEYRVLDTESRRVTRVSPRDELTALQTSMMSTQPDMIRQYAAHLAKRIRDTQQRNVHVYVDTAVSLNGRRAQALLDPHCDLAKSISPLMHDPCILDHPK